MGNKIFPRGLAVALLAALLLVLATIPAGAVSKGDVPVIRVLLDGELAQVDFQVEQGSYQLIDGHSGKEISPVKAGEKWTVKKNGADWQLSREGTPLPGTFGGPIQLKARDAGTLNLFRYQGQRYRGSLNILKGDNGLMAINTLDLEQYLYGVVGREMPASAGLDALKAQAVIARSYAVTRLKPAALYDVTDDTMTQVYGGYEAEVNYGPYRDKVIQAVDATRGLVIYYDGKVIEAYFHANAGGYTEDSENVWSNPLPYLRGVPSPEDEWALKYPNQTPGGYPANSYTWTVTLTRQQVQEKVNAWLAGQGQGEAGDVVDLVLSRLRRDEQGETVSGRVTRMDIRTTTGTASAFRDGIRAVFGRDVLKSTLFNVQMDSTVHIVDGSGGQRSVNYGAELVALGAGGVMNAPNGAAGEYMVAGRDGSRSVPKMFRQVVFQGRGNGHGLGLSQWGAMGMAEKGYTYQQIIEHYYNQDRFDGRLKIAPL
ncbi:SpoIID/LytB domain-containing protein [Neomoorella mulderi]|uniref:Amidase enhancer n=1 Tax=Moorella mulderi DSM 14980 TaxID=1122241 RepID=A0A151AXP3_9FIRM|nr:SpoIID/LytB domain-containing protein [Moorella mulderi]KYH32340.1 amidase enhancer precursor [Moorella mulderi DSM 14980]